MKLAIIGASYLQLPLIIKAKEMGIETYAFAWEDGAVGKEYCDFFYPISITEKEDILEKCREIQIDGITTIASDLAVITVNYVANALGLVGNSMFSTEVMTNKYSMRKQLHNNGLPCPKFIMVEDTDKIATKTKDFLYPLIVKPTDRSGSRGITKVESFEELSEAIERAIKYSLSDSAIVEEFVTGNEVSVETISYNGKHYHLAITDKVTTGAPYFVELEHHQPSKFVDICNDQIKAVVEKSLDTLGLKNGASHCELLISSENEITIVEIGGRMGGDFIGSDLVQLSTEYDFVKGVIEVALGEFTIPSTITYKHCSGVKFVTTDTGVVKSIKENQNFDNSIIYKKELMINIGDSVKPIRESSDRVGYFIYQSDTRYTEDDFPYFIEIQEYNNENTIQ